MRLSPLPALRLAQVRDEVDSTDQIGAAITALLDTLTTRLGTAGIPTPSHSVRTYHGRPDGTKIDVTVGIPVEPDTGPVRGLEVVDLTAEARAAVVTHRGPTLDIADAWRAMDIELAEQDLESHGLHREIHHLDATDLRVVELQCPVRDSGSPCP